MLASLLSLIGKLGFSSAAYLFVLALAVIVYFLLPGPRTRVAWLLAFSVTFYALLSPTSLLILLAVAGLSFVGGLLIESASEDTRDYLLAALLFLLVGTLLGFKYLDLSAGMGDRIVRFTGVDSPALRIALPLGISFWMFQAVAYVVDVYRGKTAAERNPFHHLLAVSFFPVVTAGPITKVQALTEQFRLKHRFDYSQMNSGLLLITRGFFKKLMIADKMAVFVNAVYENPRDFHAGQNSSVLLVAAVFFSIQLYCDFSGYTDIVRGSARLFGIELPLNFRAPYLATSVREFWRRWHITLMDWFKEYVYIPLGGNRVGPVRRYANLLTVFAISGLWHGNGLTYLVWGLLNGFYVVGGGFLAPYTQRLGGRLRVKSESAGYRLLQTVVTFTLITIAWVFFRATSLSDALYVAGTMFVPSPSVFADGTLTSLGLSTVEIAIAIASAVLVFAAEWASERGDLLAVVRARPLVLRWAAYYSIVLAVVIFGSYGSGYNAADFVYFKY